MATNLDVDAAVGSAEQDQRMSVTEVWPGQFEPEITPDEGGVSTTTIHTLETAQLHRLSEQIMDALRKAH